MSGGLQYLGSFGQCGIFSISVTFDSTSNALFQMSGKETKDDLDDLVNSIENASVGQKSKKKKNKKKKDEGGENIHRLKLLILALQVPRSRGPALCCSGQSLH